ncbi:MAG TPA: glycosyltransferase family 4 protein, partial [Pirellulales bacterium]
PHRVPLYRDLAILLCTRWMFRRTIFRFHATGLSELYPQLPRLTRWLFRKALFYPDAAIRITNCGPNDAAFLQARHEYVVPNGIDDEFVNYRQSNVEAQNPTCQQANDGASQACPLRILFVGILRESKGVGILLEACGQLAAGGMPLELEIAGEFQSPEYENELRGRIVELGLQERVRLLGLVQNDAKWAAFARADVLCLPTHYESETFPGVLLEAMSFGLPVVATRWRGIPEIVDDGATGFLVEPHDPQAVADRLARLAGDSIKRRQLGALGRQKFLEQFTTASFCRRMEQVFLEIAQVK